MFIIAVIFIIIAVLGYLAGEIVKYKLECQKS